MIARAPAGETAGSPDSCPDWSGSRWLLLRSAGRLFPRTGTFGAECTVNVKECLVTLVNSAAAFDGPGLEFLRLLFLLFISEDINTYPTYVVELCG